MLLKMVVDYCSCVDDIPTATPDILSRLIELLKVRAYNHVSVHCDHENSSKYENPSK